MRKHGNAQQEGQKIKSSDTHEEAIPFTVNSTSASRENAQFPPGSTAGTSPIQPPYYMDKKVPQGGSKQQQALQCMEEEKQLKIEN